MTARRRPLSTSSGPKRCGPLAAVQGLAVNRAAAAPPNPIVTRPQVKCDPLVHETHSGQPCVCVCAAGWCVTIPQDLSADKVVPATTAIYDCKESLSDDMDEVDEFGR